MSDEMVTCLHWVTSILKTRNVMYTVQRNPWTYTLYLSILHVWNRYEEIQYMYQLLKSADEFNDCRKICVFSGVSLSCFVGLGFKRKNNCCSGCGGSAFYVMPLFTQESLTRAMEFSSLLSQRWTKWRLPPNIDGIQVGIVSVCYISVIYLHI